MRCRFCQAKSNLQFCNKECQFAFIQGDAQDEHGSTVLMYAVSNPNNDAMVERILSRPKTDVNVQNNEGWVALMYAIRYGSPRMVQMLLSHPTINPNLQDINGDSALMMAARYGKEKKVQILLNDPRVNPNLQDNNGWTALMLAGRHIAIVRMLLQHPRIDKHIRNNSLKTAYILAAGHLDRDTIRMLLSPNQNKV